MSFASESGYIPQTIPALMGIVRENINTQFGTDYTETSFLGTNFYKYFYALIQELQRNEVKTSEIFQRLKEYFKITNEKILRPNTTGPGIFDYFQSKGYFVSVKPPIDEDAGKLFICADVDGDADDYADTKLALAKLVKDCCVGGVIPQGSEVETLTLSNGQAFDYKFALPDRIPVKLRLTNTLSDNNQFFIQSPDWVKERLVANIAARYHLGMNFEPQRYFSVVDAPWAAMVLLEWSDDGGSTWHDEIFEADFDEVFTFDITDISVIEE